MPKKIDLNGNSSSLVISVAELQAHVNRYKNERHKHITAHMKVDSRAVWLSRNKVMDFFSNNPSATGVRIYFGVIDDANTPTGVHNLVFVPTADKAGTSTDNLGDQDSVMVTQNFAASTTASSFVCPPPQPCTP
ncbi:MAG: hypothetical protein HYR66_02425 [Sphingobacteriales bacterium]|nr:hypothetical protein [Sphingobacteriales bacterium]